MRISPFLKQTLVMLLVVAVSILGCRFTNGLFSILIVLLGIVFALQRKAGWTIVCYMQLYLLRLFTTALIGKNLYFTLSARIGSVFLVLVMLLQSGSARKMHRIPINSLWAYLFCAILSSLGGWFPMISYLKLFNFAMLLLGIYFVGQSMQQSDRDLENVRAAIMAFAIIVIGGSFVARFIPEIGYSMELASAERYGNYLIGDEVLTLEKTTLFSGVLFHSQALGPVVSFYAIWLLCDMLFVERRMAKLHLLLLAIAPFVLWMTRSRTAFVIIAGSLMVMYLVGLPMASLSPARKARLRIFFTVLLVLTVAGLVMLQIAEGTVSKWLRKTDDLAGDSRSLTTAVTDTRMSLIMRDIADFQRNPLFGKGFQVSEWHPAAFRAGAITIWSAPIEKGPLPIMILGEGGILGEIMFIIFLVAFVAFCLKRKYAAMLTLFSCFLLSNLGETTFFSPSGVGGIGWIVFAVGGACIDWISKRQTEHRFDMSVRWGDIPLDGQGMPRTYEKLVEDQSGRKRVVEEERVMKRYG